jgi:hypothetical protein
METGIDTAGFFFPKPKDIFREPESVRVYPDGREVLNKMTAEGKQEYRSRTLKMLDRQGERCCLEGFAPMCPGLLSPDETTFEHEWGRGGGKRDDRIELPDGTWINGAAHARCNGWKGSRFIPYNRTLQRRNFALYGARKETLDGC